MSKHAVAKASYVAGAAISFLLSVYNLVYWEQGARAVRRALGAIHSVLRNSDAGRTPVIGFGIFGLCIGGTLAMTISGSQQSTQDRRNADLQAKGDPQTSDASSSRRAAT